ncbi:fatty acid metabolism transcriptional regulator FadR [Pasteurellaceae bacterium LIM206]|nr:fatty acid metabolism transcriptional regulator FadR [Pasteurellaceae bacterium LIM206]
MANKDTILKARSPAALAEEYIIKSIWSKYFPPGSDLPAERELAEKIGVTRTTLREVLQRLSRDGWLTIQHGKPTRVNDIWESSGLNILEVLVRLDSTISPFLIANVLAARTQIASIYVPRAFKKTPDACLDVLDQMDSLKETAESYTNFDYLLFHRLAFIAANPIYALVFNSLKGLYMRVGVFYFNIPEARTLAKRFYTELRSLCNHGKVDLVYDTIRQYGKDSNVIWTAHEAELLAYLREE